MAEECRDGEHEFYEQDAGHGDDENGQPATQAEQASSPCPVS